jgi:hypothetical protein
MSIGQARTDARLVFRWLGGPPLFVRALYHPRGAIWLPAQRAQRAPTCR